MENLGFCVFGRPTAHDYVSNGLATELNVGDETYLDYNLIELKQGERLIKISRKVVLEKEIIKIYIFDYALSFNERSGGFIGSAYVFAGQPTQKLLYNAIKYIHGKALQLLDKNRKFKTGKLNLEPNDFLINPSTEGLIQGLPRMLKKQPSDKNLYTVLTDGPVLNHLMSVVQGFMYNPNFSNIETLYVSDNKKLLDRITKNDNKKILSLSHVLNFNNHFKALNEGLKKKKIELNNINIKIEEEIANHKIKFNQQLEKEQRKLDGLLHEINSKEKEIEKINKEDKLIQDRLKSLKTNFEKAKQDKDKLDSAINQLEEKKDKLSKETQANFNKIINDKKYREQKDKLIRSSNEYNDLIKEKEKLKEELTEAQNKPIGFGRKPKVIFGGILMTLLFTGYMFGNYFPFSNTQNEIIDTAQSEVSSEVRKENNDNKKTKSLELPEEYSTKEFMELDTNSVSKHSSKLDSFLTKLETNFPEEEDYDLTDFFERKWNFAELIDVKKFDNNKIDPGLERIAKIKSLYEKYEKPIDIFNKKFALAEIDDELISKNIDFKTSKRNDILNKYLKESNNIYSKLGLDIPTGGTVDYEKDHRLVYMHFRWMVYNLSDHVDANDEKSSDANLKKTNQSMHKVLLIK